MKKKKELTYYYILEEIRIGKLFLQDIFNFYKNKTRKSINKKAYLDARKKYFIEELYPLIVVYKSKYPDKKIKFPNL